ncbi:hypothetical protein TALC_00865 [Thermoplasmatales archaeon BRNA1]|nr:hypothetical protein TALC_00865 [Thermoplasmatales archaeon BRNA1]
MRDTVIVYEVRVAGNVLASFSDEDKAKREMKKLRREGQQARVYTKWIPVAERPQENKTQTKKKETKPKKKPQPIIRPKVQPKPRNDFREGWYVLDWGGLLFLQRSEEPLEPKLQGMFDCYLDYSLIEPKGDDYDMDGGLVAYKESESIDYFIGWKFDTEKSEFVDVDDPYELREAFETEDRMTIAKYIKRYPKLWVF